MELLGVARRVGFSGVRVEDGGAGGVTGEVGTAIAFLNTTLCCMHCGNDMILVQLLLSTLPEYNKSTECSSVCLSWCMRFVLCWICLPSVSQLLLSISCWRTCLLYVDDILIYFVYLYTMLKYIFFGAILSEIKLIIFLQDQDGYINEGNT